MGPTVSWSHTRDHDFEPTNGAQFKDTRWGAGVAGSLGAEWFASRRLSLVGELGWALKYEHSSRSSQYGDLFPGGRFRLSESRESLDGISFDSDRGRLGLSFYL